MLRQDAPLHGLSRPMRGSAEAEATSPASAPAIFRTVASTCPGFEQTSAAVELMPSATAGHPRPDVVLAAAGAKNCDRCFAVLLEVMKRQAVLELCTGVVLGFMRPQNIILRAG